jgi:hypothetical protein
MDTPKGSKRRITEKAPMHPDNELCFIDSNSPLSEAIMNSEGAGRGAGGVARQV